MSSFSGNITTRSWCLNNMSCSLPPPVYWAPSTHLSIFSSCFIKCLNMLQRKVKPVNACSISRRINSVLPTTHSVLHTSRQQRLEWTHSESHFSSQAQWGSAHGDGMSWWKVIPLFPYRPHHPSWQSTMEACAPPHTCSAACAYRLHERTMKGFSLS